MSQALILIGFFVVGWLLRQFKGLPEDMHRHINKFIIWLPLPCITLINVPKIHFGPEVVFPVAAAWAIFFGAMLFFALFRNVLRMDKATWACLVMVCGLGNTSFVGYPVLKAIYGESAISYAILVDQPGTFLALSTVGVILVMSVSTGTFSLLPVVKRLFTFPPFLAFAVALVLPWEWLTGDHMLPLQYIGSLMVPLAMMSVGMQFRTSREDVNWGHFAVGLSYKLILAPFFIGLVLFCLLGKKGLIYEVTVMECAMPPMITASVLASEYGLDPRLANVLVTWGIPLSAVTLFLWQQVISRL